MKEEATCFTEEFYEPIIIKIILIIATVTRGNLYVKDIMCSGLSELYSLTLILLQKQPHEARCTKTMTTILYGEIKVKRKTMGVNNLSISYGKDRSM